MANAKREPQPSELATEKLRTLSSEGVCGEFVVVGADVEVRIFLEKGRIAWASSSRAKNAFANFLEDVYGVEHQAIIDAVRECQSSKRPIGRVLVEWGIVTKDQVQAALRSQLQNALADMQSAGPSCETLFVPRRSKSTRFQTFTFDVEQLNNRINETAQSAVQTAAPTENQMATFDLTPLSEVDGYIASALVDGGSGMVMAEHGHAPFPLDVAAAGNTQVVAAKRKTMKNLGLADKVEDILISLGSQYHIIRPVDSNDQVFIYVVLDRAKTNLAMARHVIRDFEKKTTI